MTYQELKEQIEQQGTQCGVNLGMSSAVLNVECKNWVYDESEVLAEIAVAFGILETSEDGITKTKAAETLKLLQDLSLKGELPTIRLIDDVTTSIVVSVVYGDPETFGFTTIGRGALTYLDVSLYID